MSPRRAFRAAGGGRIIRGLVVAAIWAVAIAVGALALKIGTAWWILAAVLAALAGLGTWDLLQTRHSILRAYPILGHARFVAELIRPEIYQYFIESNTDSVPVGQTVVSPPTHTAFTTSPDLVHFIATPRSLSGGKPVSCIQAMKCHTNRCPTGVATQDAGLARAFHVPDKIERVANFQQAPVASAAQMVASMGLDSFAELQPSMLHRRIDSYRTRTYAEIYEWLMPGELLDDPPQTWLSDRIEASAEEFG